MTTFRYEAVNAEGTPIHGTIDVQDKSALVDELAARGLRLVSATELTLDSLLGDGTPDLPRLYQLRIGESLREAFLTGLPAHDAVRAIAAEPFSHPVLGIFPWMQGIAVFVFTLAMLKWTAIARAAAPPWTTGLVCCGLIPFGWSLAWFVYSYRPRRLLHRLADQLESGNTEIGKLVGALPHELQTVMTSDVEPAKKIRTVAELMPTLLSSGVRNQQFAINVIGPLVMLSIMFLGMYALLAFVVPDFRKIFEDFGTALPVMTQVLIDLSAMVSVGGSAGWIVSAVVAVVMLVAIFWLLTTGKVSELLESVPLLGMGFRWNMQVRVARVLASMIRNDCDYAESLRTATAGSEFVAVRVEGRLLASQLEGGSKQSIATRKLNGLPMSLLFFSDPGKSAEERRGMIAATFDNLADMLQHATLSQGRLVAMLLQFIVIGFSGFCIGFGVVALFFPLIKLLNDLS